jgi:hypothetical protein
VDEEVPGESFEGDAVVDREDAGIARIGRLEEVALATVAVIDQIRE